MANFKIQNVRIQLKHDTATNWAASDLIPLAGELCLDTTNNVIKIGDGEHKFSQLNNAGSVITNASAYDATNNPGGIDEEHGGIKVNGTDINVYTLNKAATNALGGILSAGNIPNAGAGEVGKVYVNTSTGAAFVEYVAFADQLKTARTVTFENNASDNTKVTDATGSFTFDGSGNVSTHLTLVDKFDTGAGNDTKRVVVATVDKKGRVIGEGTLVTADISNAVAASAGNGDAAKAIKTNSDGELDDTFLNDAFTGTVNTGENDAPFTAVKVDAKGRVISATTAASTIAKNKDTTTGIGHQAQLGFVQSDYDDAAAATPAEAAIADVNKGKVAIDSSGNMTITRVAEADKFHTARTISFADHAAGEDPSEDPAIRTDVTGSITFDGSDNVTGQLQLKDQNSITITAPATSARATVVNVNKQGLVVSTEALVSDDVSDAKAASTGSTDAEKVIKTNSTGKLDDTFLKDITEDQSTDNTSTAESVITSITVDTKGRITKTTKMGATVTGGSSTASGKLVKLAADGKLDNTIIPALAIGEVFTVTYSDSETVGVNDVVAFKGITRAESGDVVVVTTTQGASETQATYEARCVTNGDGVYIYAGNTSGAETYSTSNWKLMKVPGQAIQSVNGHTGPTVVLSTSDISEGTNLYYTSARAVADAEQTIASGFYLLDCGNAGATTSASPTGNVDSPTAINDKTYVTVNS